MKVEFTRFPDPVKISKEVLENLSKEGERFFILYQERTVRTNWWEDKEEITKKIGVLEILPNTYLVNHDFGYNYNKIELLGYCPIFFSEEGCKRISI